MNQRERIHIFCQEIWSWFARNKRTLPWRDLRTKNLNHKAYLILVSEVMLQQTQVPRVVLLYKQFTQKFPRIEDLAKASNREVLIAWRGLGYNNRAMRLRDAARAIITRGGEFPSEMSELMGLPGVGHYTSAAVRNFAFDIPTPCIDVNIRRILHRFFVGPENRDGSWKKDDTYLLRLAEEVLREADGSRVGRVSKVSKVGKVGKRDRGTAAWHAALMDFGALVCTKNNPRWDLFSKGLQSCCMAYGKYIVRTKKVNSKEPGREIAGRYVPNRIIRGRIIEVLRDHTNGLSSDDIGRLVTVDWSMEDHRAWLEGILQGLLRDHLITVSRNRYSLSP